MRKFLTTLAALVTLCVGTIGCSSTNTEESADIMKDTFDPVSIEVGDEKTLQRNPRDAVGVRYSGMNADESRFILNLGDHDNKINIFYPSNRKEIIFNHLGRMYGFRVNFVCPDSINLTYLGYEKIGD